MRFKIATILLALFVSYPLQTKAQSYHSHRRSERPHGGEPGVFDFYLLVLSWSPEFCYSHASAAQCSQHAGFLVHGLWPQNADGTYPSECQTNQPAPRNTSAVSDIMPAEIIEHEWRQHGTCSGLSGDDYFALIRRVYESIRMPDSFRSPGRSFATSPHKLKSAFEQANPGLGDSNLAVQLRGNYLNAVEICVSKAAKPSPVTCENVRDANRGTFIVPPVR